MTRSTAKAGRKSATTAKAVTKTAAAPTTTRKKATAKAGKKTVAAARPATTKKAPAKPAAKKASAARTAGQKPARKTVPASKTSRKAASKAVTKKSKKTATATAASSAEKATATKTPKTASGPKAASPKPGNKKTASKTAASKTAASKTAASEKATGKKVAGKKVLGKKAAGATGGRTSRRRTPEPPAPRSVAAAASAMVADADGYVVVHGRRIRAISTKGIVIKKKSRSASLAQSDNEPIQTLDPSTLKTKLSKKDLDRYRDLLLIRRSEILGLVNDMEAEALRSSGGNLSHMPIHMADIGSDTAEQDFTLSMAEKERQMLVEIYEALDRIAAGTYGVCHATGKMIPKARLEAKPWAKYTIEAARLNEAGRLI